MDSRRRNGDFTMINEKRELLPKQSEKLKKIMLQKL